jgi:hypothetical protein
MFTVDPTITDLRAKERSMLKVLFSMNTHQVATPEMNLEQARSYVIFCREGGGKISAYIGLHLLDTNRRLFYPHSSNPFPEEDMSAVDEEARGFAEGLGAMLDEIDITKMSVEEKNHWIDDQAIFNLKKQIEAKPSEQTEVAASAASEQPSVPSPPAQEAPAPAAPVATTSVAQPAPVVQAAPIAPPQEVAAPAAPVQTAPIPSSPEPSLQPSVQPIPPKQPAAAPTKAAQQVSAKLPEDVIQRAIKAGVVKAPKAQLNKEIRSITGIVSRDKEALARLLSSF